MHEHNPSIFRRDLGEMPLGEYRKSTNSKANLSTPMLWHTVLYQ
jgi:hypothetical protein